MPSYLTGELPGDYGYDPLGLGQDPAQVQKYRANELLHARWAMLAAAGIIIPEGLEANGADIKGGTWFETGAVLLNDNLNYFAVPWGVISVRGREGRQAQRTASCSLPSAPPCATYLSDHRRTAPCALAPQNPLPLVVVIAIEVGLMGAVERYRASGEGPAKGYAPGVGEFDESIFQGMDPLYPGGPFDPLGLSNDPEVFAEMKVKEIKNGRLAMVSVLGFAIQGLVTGEGPYANWSKHVADPFGYNLLTVIGNTERIPTL